MDQRDIDDAIQHYYTHDFDEDDRLRRRSVQGQLEFIRSQELVGQRVAPGSRIVDIGGATGIHAAPLAEQGHDVVLVEPVRSMVQKARQHGGFAAMVGDARDLPFDDNTFDAALMFGPLYHLQNRSDRLRCLREARRVVRPGGWVFAAAIPRFICHAALTLGEQVPSPYPRSLVELLQDGSPTGAGPFPAGHFHTGEELQSEMLEAGLDDVEIHAIEGCAGLPLEELAGAEPDLVQAALTLVRRTGHIPGIRDMTNHMMGIGRSTAP